MYANLAKIFPGDLLQSLETPGFSRRVDRYATSPYNEKLKFYRTKQTTKDYK